MKAGARKSVRGKHARAQLIAELDRRGLDPRQLTQYWLDKIVRDLPRVWEEDLSTEAELFGVSDLIWLGFAENGTLTRE